MKKTAKPGISRKHETIVRRKNRERARMEQTRSAKDSDSNNSYVRPDFYNTIWQLANNHFKRSFINNEFGSACSVCDRLWFKNDMKCIDSTVAALLAPHFPGENVVNFKLCRNCIKSCKSGKIPSMSRTNGYFYPPKPDHLPKLDPIAERLISPRIPFMQIRRLRRQGSYGIVGQVINVPVDVKTMVSCLPRSLSDDHAFNVNLKRNIVHKSTYLSGYVRKSTVEAWLRYLVNQPLYKYYNISIDWSMFDHSVADSTREGDCPDKTEELFEVIEPLKVDMAPETGVNIAQRQTMLGNEESGLDNMHKDIIDDTYADDVCLDVAKEVHKVVEPLNAHSVSELDFNIALQNKILCNEESGQQNTPEYFIYDTHGEGDFLDVTEEILEVVEPLHAHRVPESDLTHRAQPHTAFGKADQGKNIGPGQQEIPENVTYAAGVCPDVTEGGFEWIEPLNAHRVPESEVYSARQHSMLWNEDQCLDIAPGQRSIPENIIYDTYAEELSFPAIYYGVGRCIRDGVRSTPFMMCMSEIRRKDRRGVTPHHVLYMAMKILRIRVRDGVYNSFRCLRDTEQITRRMIEDKECIERLIDTNLAFLNTIPNSVQYWSHRKKDLFAMIRQLGKPTAFLTMSANETHWPNLLRILHRLSDEFKSLGEDMLEDDIFEKLDRYKRAHLVAEDPVACSIYFNKLMRVVMAMLCSMKSYNPFGEYRVKDYFLRIEFQHRGSPHAHILLWLNNDPCEPVGESMPLTIRMLTDLCSVDKNDISDPKMISNQTHSHTFTCTKRGEDRCRFNIPYWPMRETCILVPLAKDDSRRELYKRKVNDARNKLETKAYEKLNDFLNDISCSDSEYLDLIRSTLRRPTVCFKRDMSQICVNTFNPWIASVLNSNMDLQIILDAYSCAAYVVEYVNKSNRGISQLHRELTMIQEKNPEYDHTQLMTKVGLKMLNAVEMSAQEAAWYLLRQPMSWASRNTVAIPTVWPHERHKARKQKSTMDAEGLSEESTDIWTKSMIQKYEERPIDLESTTLAQFIAWYNPVRTAASKIRNDDDDMDLDNLEEDCNNDDSTVGAGGYKRRVTCRIIRYRNYDVGDVRNYKREMVTLYLPFRNEHVEIIDRDKFLKTYDEHEREILERRKEFEANMDIDAIMQEIEALFIFNDQVTDVDPPEARASCVPEQRSNNDDFEDSTIPTNISAVRRRENVMSKKMGVGSIATLP